MIDKKSNISLLPMDVLRKLQTMFLEGAPFYESSSLGTYAENVSRSLEHAY